MFALLYTLSYLLCFAPFAASFSFTASTLSECDEFSVEWTGGTGPYQLQILPSFGTQRNITIPGSAYSNGRGSYSMQLALPKDQELVLVMSDATGFGAGGSTQVLRVEESRGGSCNTTDPGVDFPFQLNYALQQCRPFTFEGYERAVQPVTIWVVVPGGKATSIPVPAGSQRFSWPAAIPGGTSAMFMMSDARGGFGGVSDVKQVGASDERSCLNDAALSSTFVPTTPTAKPSAPPAESGTESSAPSASSTSSTGVPISAIAGTVIGSLLFLAVIVTLGLFFLKNVKKKRDRTKDAQKASNDYFDHGSGPYGPSGVVPPYGSSSARLENPFADSSPDVHALGPYPNSSPSDPFQSRPYYPPSPYTPSITPSDPFNPSGPQTLPSLGINDPIPTSPTDQSGTLRTTSSAQEKATMADASMYRPQRFIVHEDAEDIIPPPNVDGVVELPPTYSERRGASNFVLVNPDPPSPATRRIADTHQDSYNNLERFS